MKMSAIKHAPLKVLISVAFVGIIFWQVDLSETASLLSRLSIPLFLAVITIGLADQLFLGLKWNLLLRVMDVRVPVSVPIVAYLRARVFKLVVPSSLGVDAYKAYYLRRFSATYSAVISSIVIERLFGMLSSLLVIMTFAYFWLTPLEVPNHTELSVLGIVGALFLAALIIYGLTNAKKLGSVRAPTRFLPPKVKTVLDSVFGQLANLEGQMSSVLVYTFLSALEKASFGLLIYFSMLAIGVAGPSPVFLIAAAPALALLERLPISVAAIGLREGVLVALFLPFGVEASEAIAVALVLRAAELVQIALLFFIWYIDPAPRPTEADVLSVTSESSDADLPNVASLVEART